MHARITHHLEFSQNNSIAKKLRKQNIPVIFRNKETHLRVNIHTNQHHCSDNGKIPAQFFHTEGIPNIYSSNGAKENKKY
jgi:hypothetical protein